MVRTPPTTYAVLALHERSAIAHATGMSIASHLRAIAPLAAVMAALYDADPTQRSQEIARAKGEVGGRLAFLIRQLDRLISDERTLAPQAA